MIILADGTLWGIGANNKGQLGDGTNTDRDYLVQIGTDSNWQSIVAGNLHTIGIKSDGTLWAWGNNSNGELGDGTTTQQNSPIQIGTDTNWQKIATGYQHTVALKSDGTLWAWGSNGNGELGDGTTTAKLSPIQIGTDTNWQKVEAGASSSWALKSDGTLWAWGYNLYGQLGDGTTTDKNSSIQIGTDTNWKDIYIYARHVLALKNDGTLWAWGWNHNGQLGFVDGQRDNPSPINVTTTIYKIPLHINLNDVNKSEHNVTSIRIYGIDGKLDELNLSMITDGDNNFTKAIYPDNNYTVELNVSKDGVATKWYYNFSDGVTYLNNTSTSDFKKEINLSNRSLNIDLSSFKWENFDAIFTPSQTSLDFGSIAEYSTKSLPLTITNSGKSSGVVEFSLNSNSFSVTPSSCSLAIGGSCQVSVTFSATSTNSYSDTLSIKNSATNIVTSVALSGSCYSTYVPPTTNIIITTTTKDNTITLSDNGEVAIDNLNSNIVVSENGDGSTTFDITSNTSQTTVNVNSDGTSSSTTTTIDSSGNTIKTNVNLPIGTKVSIDTSGNIIQNVDTTDGTSIKVTTSTDGSVKVNLKTSYRA